MKMFCDIGYSSMVFLPYEFSYESSKKLSLKNTCGIDHTCMISLHCGSSRGFSKFIHSFISSIYIAPLQLGLLRGYELKIIFDIGYSCMVYAFLMHSQSSAK